jgi:hypothetical protein
MKKVKDSAKTQPVERMMPDELDYPNSPRYEDKQDLVSRLSKKQGSIPDFQDIIDRYNASLEPEQYVSTRMEAEDDYMDEAKLANLGLSGALAKQMRWKYARPENINQWEINRNRKNKSLANKAAELTDTEAMALNRSLKSMNNASDLLKPSKDLPVTPPDREFLKDSYNEADKMSDSIMNNRKQRLKEVLNSPKVPIDSLPENVVGEAKESMRSKSLKNASKFGKLMAKLAAPVQAGITAKEVYDNRDNPDKIPSAIAESLVPISEEEIKKIRDMEQSRLQKDEEFRQAIKSGELGLAKELLKRK